jgi:hypothetical protein
MEIPPEECFELAHEKELKPGELLLVHMAEHYTREQQRIARIRSGGVN